MMHMQKERESALLPKPRHGRHLYISEQCSMKYIHGEDLYRSIFIRIKHCTKNDVASNVLNRQPMVDIAEGPVHRLTRKPKKRHVNQGTHDVSKTSNLVGCRSNLKKLQ